MGLNGIVISLYSSYGEGITGNKSVSQGTTIGNLYNEVTGESWGSSVVRLNGQAANSQDYVLVDGDQVTFAPKKIVGA